MRMMLALVALFGLAAHPAMAAPPVEKGVKELATGQKPSQETPAAAKPPEGSMVLVPAGEFMMGSATGDADEQPVHKVYVDAFFMDKYQVTVGQYAAFLEATGDRSTVGLEDHEPTDAPEASRSPMWIGRMRPRTANGPASACRPRRSGRRRRGGRMAGSIPGGMSLRRRFTRTLGKRSGTITWVLAPVGIV